jgi:hypothetical protein
MQIVGIFTLLIAFFILHKVVDLDARRKLYVGVNGLAVLSEGFGICSIGIGDTALMIREIVSGVGGERRWPGSGCRTSCQACISDMGPTKGQGASSKGQGDGDVFPLAP